MRWPSSRVTIAFLTSDSWPLMPRKARVLPLRTSVLTLFTFTSNSFSTASLISGLVAFFATLKMTWLCSDAVVAFGDHNEVYFSSLIFNDTSGQGLESAIVNNTSVSGIRNPNPGLALYGASKAAAIALTRAAAMEYASKGIRINAIAPGRVVTDMMLSSDIADMRSVAAGLPLRRMGHPEEIAAAVVWLLSGEASYIVGHVLGADGGFLAG